MTQWTRMSAIALLAAALAGPTAFAQTAAPTPERQPADQPERIQPRSDGPSRAEAPRPDGQAVNPPSGGVIRPPAVQDRGVLAPPNEDRAKMPEIRPPGT